MAKRRCSIEGCDRPQRSRGWCSMHYQRWRQHGDPHVMKRTTRNGEPQVLAADILKRWRAGTLPTEPCMVWPYNTIGRHGRAGMTAKRGPGDYEMVYVARWLLIESNPPGAMDGLVTRHTCDNPRCVNPHHLEPGTYADNTRDMIDRERCGTTRLTADQVKQIIQRYATGQSYQYELAEEFGVSQATISCIVNRKTWTHLPDPSGSTTTEMA